MRTGWSTNDRAIVLVRPADPATPPREEERPVRIVVPLNGRVSLALGEPLSLSSQKSGALLWLYDDHPWVIGCRLGG